MSESKPFSLGVKIGPGISDAITPAILKELGFTESEHGGLSRNAFTWLPKNGEIAYNNRVIVENVRSLGQLKGLFTQITGISLDD